MSDIKFPFERIRLKDCENRSIRPPIHPSIQSQSERQSTPWTGCQSVTHSLSYSAVLTSAPMCCPSYVRMCDLNWSLNPFLKLSKLFLKIEFAIGGCIIEFYQLKFY